MRDTEPTTPNALRVVGVDDFALRKGQTYGTVVVDLERHRSVAILSGRTAEELAAWLRNHPTIEVVTRDRSTEFARAINLSLPVATYTGPDGELTVNHKGAANTRAALGWISENFSAPETVFVTGVSAGAYASIVWLPEIADEYPDADVYQLGDSGAGVVTEDFFTGDAANWQLEDALPNLDEPVVLDEEALTNLYTAVGQSYPKTVLSQYNSLFDGTQIAFYGLMRGISPPTQELSLEWSQKMTASLMAITGETENFRSYLSTLDVDNDPANGTTHDILFRPEFYTLETGGVRFVDWLSDLVSGRDVESVSPPATQGEL